MWISLIDEPIPTYGMNGESFMLSLHYQSYYGHITKTSNEVVIATWDSINECFYEKDTGIEIDKRDIAMWWKEV